MPDLIHSLQSYDLGHLRIVAGLWGLELVSPDSQTALQELAVGLLDGQLVDEIIDTLSSDAKKALRVLLTEKGRMPWQDFTRRFGELRDAGSGRRDREKIYLSPISSTEVLFYRALVGRAFFETASGPQEFAYIPDDLLLLLPPKDSSVNLVPGRLASPLERRHPIPCSDRILDDACTLLTAMRMGWQVLPDDVTLIVPERVLREFLLAASLIRFPKYSSKVPALQLEAIKDFLEKPRSEALVGLVHAWQNSVSFNELHQVPGLVCEGTWHNDPCATRQFILGLLNRIPPGKWWSLSSFAGMIRETNPDFERPAGDFDSWLIRRETDNTFLHGFAHWEDVEGALVRYLVTGPLYWLGIVDLASAEIGGLISSFRLTNWSTDLMNNRPPQGLQREDGKLHVAATGRITIPVHLPRSVRYQVARFSEWEPPQKDEFHYRLTPVSLKNALKQGLKISHLLSLLHKYSAGPLPPPFVRALTRWELNGTEASLEQPVILRLSRPEVLEELRKSRAGRFLGEVLGPTTVVVKPGAQVKILSALGELGLLTEDAIKTDIINVSDNHHE
ncbi:MAG: helicase-associated domain-containing protein [Chloroflexota bacterium]